MTQPNYLCTAALLFLSACGPGSNPAERARTPAFDAIGPEEAVRFTGTEPFWGGSIEDGTALYSTPENSDGARFPVERFSGNNGLGFSGTLGGAAWDMTITPGECSDGMSDRTYPFTVTLLVAGERREGCAWTERTPYSGTGAGR